MKILYILFFTVLIVLTSSSEAQVTGLSGWNIFLDPGHSQHENVGIYGYSEAEKNLGVALNLRDLLLSKTDIDTVYMSRTDDQEVVSLTQRTDYANTVGAAWYHSIHSDAGSPSSNSTLLMYGGWRENGQTIEKIPNGGKEMSDIIVDLLTRGMRTSTRGNYADRTFYEGFPDNTSRFVPYLHVNRESNMPSELSEAGFHTNPTQN
ncbi:MAG: N-acetylmuramoyl-L-alanine amidase, partial [Ignavibacteriaceae bacterium]